MYQKVDEEEMDSDNLTIQYSYRPDANPVENQQKANFEPINKNKEMGI